MDLVVDLSKNIEKVTFDNIPENVVLQTKKEILDVLGCIITGLQGGEASVVRKVLNDICNGQAPSNAIQKSMLMTVAARADDFDPINDDTGDHCSLSTIISGITMVSAMNGNVSGKKLLTAIALGDDLSLRIRKGTSQRLGEHPWVAATYASFAATATASKLLDLNYNQIRNALGLAYTTCSNTVQGLREGTSSYKLHHGWAIRTGIEAAFYAAAGLSGVQSVFEGEYGLYNVYHAGKYDREIILDNLGTYFHSLSIGFKPYPCCRLMHGAIEAALTIKEETHLKPELIENVVVHVNKSAYVLCGKQPWRNPEKLEELRFNIPYGVSVALNDGRVDLSHFCKEKIKDSITMELCSKVQVVEDSELNRVKKQIAPTTVYVHMKSGQVFSKTIDVPKGHPDKPLTFDELVAKFKGNLACVGIRNEEAIDQMIDSVYRLEKMDNVREMFLTLME